MERVLAAVERFRRLAYWMSLRRGMWNNLGEPEDVAQEAALAVLQLADTVAEAEDFGALLWRRVTRRLWELHYRGRIVLLPAWAARERRYSALLPEVGPLPRDELAEPANRPEESVFVLKLRKALARLPEADRRTLERRYGLDGAPQLSYREMACQEGITEHAARGRLAYLRRKLRDGLTGTMS